MPAKRVTEIRVLISILWFYGLFCISCRSDQNAGKSDYYNFSINGNGSTPILLMGRPESKDSSLCFIIEIGDTLRLSPIGEVGQIYWQLLSDKVQNISTMHVIDKVGAFTVSMVDSGGLILATKCIIVKPKNFQYSGRGISGRRSTISFNCDSVFFSNSRFDGTISGLPDGNYQVDILEGSALFQYTFQSKSGQGTFRLGRAYDQRPKLKLKRIQDLDQNSVKCLFL